MKSVEQLCQLKEYALLLFEVRKDTHMLDASYRYELIETDGTQHIHFLDDAKEAGLKTMRNVENVQDYLIFPVHTYGYYFINIKFIMRYRTPFISGGCGLKDLKGRKEVWIFDIIMFDYMHSISHDNKALLHVMYDNLRTTMIDRFNLEPESDDEDNEYWAKWRASHPDIVRELLTE